MFTDFSEAFDSLNREKMEQILLAYELPNEAITTTMMFYKDTKATICSPDGDTNFFNIDTGFLKGDTLALCFFIHCLDNVCRMSKLNPCYIA